ncbi:alpha/beta hydrolase [Polyangium sp. 15x6]|nr:alpha/beta hydrolase [Polyangium sp. 15x6]MDI3282426.1 alpha/beta hydrolase [Polyangium sp. 15x6]
MVLHGGCWTTMVALDIMSPLSEALTNEGLATWNVEFRRITMGKSDSGYPDTFLDVGAAIDELRAIAPAYDLDLDRVKAVGHSAGGQLALWAAARPRLPETSGIRGSAPLPLRGVVSLAGVLDLADATARGLCGNLADQLLGGTKAQVPERYAETNPAELLPIGVRQVLVHGAADVVVPLSGSETYRARAYAAGDRISLTAIPDADHFDVITPSSTKWPQVRARILGIYRGE